MVLRSTTRKTRDQAQILEAVVHAAGRTPGSWIGDTGDGGQGRERGSQSRTGLFGVWHVLLANPAFRRTTPDMEAPPGPQTPGGSRTPSSLSRQCSSRPGSPREGSHALPSFSRLRLSVPAARGSG